jgi:hypothetical protein
MKINKLYFLFTVFLTSAVILVFFTNTSAETTFTEKGQMIQEVERLLKERINIINDYLFNDITYLNTEKRLGSIEMEGLLREDLEVLKKIEKNPTDFPYVKDVNIENMKLQDKNGNRLEYTILVKWDISYNEVDVKEKDYYRVNLINTNNKLYLTKLQHIRALE